jgi:hypothetical protein
MHAEATIARKKGAPDEGRPFPLTNYVMSHLKASEFKAGA